MTLQPPDSDHAKLALALRYAERDWKLLLLAPETKTPINRWREGKKDGFDPAALPKGRDARREHLRSFAASSDAELVRAWLDEWPDAGLAVDCAASNLFAIDLDQKAAEGKDGNDALGRVFLKYFPSEAKRDGDPLESDYADPRAPFGSPLLSRSPSGGQHLIYAIDPLFEPDPYAATDLGHAVLGVKGLDIKWNGYIGIPSGDGRREWLNDVEPGPVPRWLYDALLALRGARAGASAEPSEPGLWTDDDVCEYLNLLNVEAFAHDGAWEEVMMGLHHVGGEAALGPFFQWCMGDPEYRPDAATILNRWRSLGKRDGDATRGEGTLLNVLGRGAYHHDGANQQWKPRHRRAENAFDVVPQAESTGEQVRKFPGLVYLSEIVSLPTQWFWKPYLPSNMFVLSDGDPGVGKTSVAFDIMARLTRGDQMPGGGPPVEAGKVLVLSCEDALQQVVRPRLEAAGADMSRIAVLNESWRVDEIDKLEALVREVRPAMVYVDSIMTSMGGGVDTHKDNQTRDRLEPLARLAERLGFILWGSRHLTKQDKDKAIYAGQGSIAFSAVARSTLVFGVNPDSPKDERMMAHPKCNVGPLGKSLRYRILARDVGMPDSMPVVEWLGESDRTADEVVSWKPEEDRRGGDRVAAAGFLTRYFATRESSTCGEVKAAAQAEFKREFSQDAWSEARRDARINSSGGGRNAIWSRADGLAAPPLDAEDELGS